MDIELTSTSQILKDVYIPPMALVRQILPRPRIDDVAAAVRSELKDSVLSNTLRSGMSVAISCGSRGITNIPLIMREIAAFCKSRGAEPFIVPAMGSHGGATAQGQTEVLANLGVTEEFCGCPIRSSMETVRLGTTDGGYPVYLDKYASQSDGIIVVGRIKAHTAFRGSYESGLMKMMAVGLGKKDGAEVCHSTGFRLMHSIMPAVANGILHSGKILLGVAIIENAYDETCTLKALAPQQIPEEEPELLLQAKNLMGRLYLPETDLLIIDRIGKNISGDGSDPNVAGNFCCPYASGGLKAEKRTVLDLTDETHGNAMGIGLYDTTTQRLFNKIDFDTTYVNPLVSSAINMARIPMIMRNDHDAIAACLRASSEIDHEAPRIIRIQDSAHIEHIYVSAAHREEVLADDRMELLSPFLPMKFTKDGNLW